VHWHVSGDLNRKDIVQILVGLVVFGVSMVAPTPHFGSTQFHSAVQNFAHFPVLGLLTVLLLTKLQSQFM